MAGWWWQVPGEESEWRFRRSVWLQGGRSGWCARQVMSEISEPNSQRPSTSLFLESHAVCGALAPPAVQIVDDIK